MSKIILSRKGYDDQYGCKPSVIMPDGTMLSFPIPVAGEEIGIETKNLKFKGEPLTEIFKGLGHSNTNLIHHIDPDIYELSGKQPYGSYGQAGAALSHLENQGVRTGDIFLFFGTFCKTIMLDNNLQFEMMHPFHAIFGYLKVERKVSMAEIEDEPVLHWLKQHPHYMNRDFGDYKKANAIYIGADYGYFKYSDYLLLTKPGYKKSWWQLPAFFADVKLSYHENVIKKFNQDFVEFQSVAKGQEFVFERNNKTEEWLNGILNHKV
jgi:hypothetical protein